MKTLTTVLFLLLGTVIIAQDKIHIHTAIATNSSGNATYIDHPDLNGNPNAGIVYVHIYNPGGVGGAFNNKVTGLWYNAGNSRWAIYNEDLSNIIIGSSYNVYMASPSNVLTHIASVANQHPSPHMTLINDTRFNNLNPGPYAIMSNYYNPNGVYNNHNYGFYYDTNLNRRTIFEEGLNPIPTDAAFKILITGSGVQRFTHQSAAGNITGNYTILDHSSLNNNPNATFVFSHYFGVNGSSSNVYINNVLGVWYTGTRWAIYTEDGSAMPVGVSLDIIVAPQVEQTYVPDNNFEQALIDLGYDTVLDDYVLTDYIDTITNLNVELRNISDLTGIEDFTALEVLNCGFNLLTSIDVSQNTSLTNLSCNSNQLTSLNLIQNTSLTNLSCNSNQLISLDLTQNLSLVYLYAQANQLTNLDISHNTILEYLFLGNNQLTNIDVSQNLNLITLDFFSNQISTLDVSQNITLTDLACSNNQLSSLDLSQNTSLVFLDCESNFLTNLNVKNGNNTNVTYFNSETNPNLLCIEVDNVAYSNSNWTLIDPASSFSENCSTTYVPDDNFEQALIDLGYDSGPLDDYVPTINIESVTFLNVSTLNISDLTGIEDFVALEFLDCRNNILTSLNTTQNTALTTLICYTNQITGLDVSMNTALNLLGCIDNQLTSIDVSQNTVLTQLYCNNNLLTSLDVSQNILLTHLWNFNNQLTNIDVTQNSVLGILYCNNNLLTALDVTQNTALIQLDCFGNLITNIDASQNTSLERLFCYNNSLEILNIKNGNNTNITDFNTLNNPNLTCIEVDNAAYSTANWTAKDIIASYSEDCHYDETYVPDNNFEQRLIDLGYDTVLDDYVLTTTINTIINLDVYNLGISDLTGIEDFTVLEVLYCDFNNLTSLDVTQNTALTYLDCSDNQLTVLDVSQNLSLATLFCNYNQLSFLSLGVNTNLSRLDCDNNLLEGIDVSYSNSLDRLNCGNNLITTLDVNLNSTLTRLECYNNNLSSLDLNQNTALTYINCRTNQLTNFNIKNGNNTNITYFNSDTNPNLFCIEVDNALYSATNWTIIDPISVFSEDCGTKIWESGAWTNGPPSILDNTIIRDNYSTVVQGANIETRLLTIDFGNTLTIGDGDYLLVEDNIIVDGALFVLNGASLVQVDNTALVINNGSITVEKITPTFTDRDFSIMGSPMSGETREGVYSTSAHVRHHLTGNFTPHPQVAIDDPGAENFADDNGDNWLAHTGALIIGEGYLIKPFVNGSSGGVFTTNYTQGTLNNGVVTFNALYGDNQNDSPNIMSNPYASSVDAFVFITDNAIVDAIYYWEHITAPTASYPGYNPQNYDMGDISMYNLSGGIAAANAGGGVQASNQFIPSGQGFAIKANAAGTVSFNNAMRLIGNNAGYRNNETIDRLYISISNETYNLKNSTLVAFTEGATDDFDSSYDAKRLATPISLYSLNNDRELGIQGRSIFNEDHIIPLGFTTHVEESQEYTISISFIEGELINQSTVYLKDNLLNTVTNLSETDYTFTSNVGHQLIRFVIVFIEEQLGTNDLSLNVISIYPNPTQNILTIVSPQVEITSIEVFDIRGRKVNSLDINNQDNYQLDMSTLGSAMYFIKINTDSGSITKRLIKE